MSVQPYLFFDGACEAALDFYVRAVGAKVGMKMRFSESPEPAAPGMVPPGSEDKIMHASFRIGETDLMASDGRCLGNARFSGFALSIAAKDAPDAERIFTALSEGGDIQMPLAQTFFSPRFGMLTDRFGVSWMVMVQP